MVAPRYAQATKKSSPIVDNNAGQFAQNKNKLLTYSNQGALYKTQSTSRELSSAEQAEMFNDLERIRTILKNTHLEPVAQNEIILIIRNYLEPKYSGSSFLLDKFLGLLKGNTVKWEDGWVEKSAIVYDRIWYVLDSTYLNIFKQLIARGNKEKTDGPMNENAEDYFSAPQLTKLAKEEAIGMWGMIKGLGLGLAGLAGPEIGSLLSKNFDECGKLFFGDDWYSSESQIFGIKIKSSQIGEIGGSIIWQIVAFARLRGKAGAGPLVTLLDKLDKLQKAQKVLGVLGGVQGTIIGAKGIAEIIESEQKKKLEQDKKLTIEDLLKNPDFIAQIETLFSSLVNTYLAVKTPGDHEKVSRARIQILLNAEAVLPNLGKLIEIAQSEKPNSEKERSYGEVLTELIPQLVSIAFSGENFVHDLNNAPPKLVSPANNSSGTLVAEASPSHQKPTPVENPPSSGGNKPQTSGSRINEVPTTTKSTPKSQPELKSEFQGSPNQDADSVLPSPSVVPQTLQKLNIPNNSPPDDSKPLVAENKEAPEVTKVSGGTAKGSWVYDDPLVVGQGEVLYPEYVNNGKAPPQVNTGNNPRKLLKPSPDNPEVINDIPSSLDEQKKPKLSGHDRFPPDKSGTSMAGDESEKLEGSLEKSTGGSNFIEFPLSEQLGSATTVPKTSDAGESEAMRDTSHLSQSELEPLPKIEAPIAEKSLLKKTDNDQQNSLDRINTLESERKNILNRIDGLENKLKKLSLKNHGKKNSEDPKIIERRKLLEDLKRKRGEIESTINKLKSDLHREVPRKNFESYKDFMKRWLDQKPIESLDSYHRRLLSIAGDVAKEAQRQSHQEGNKLLKDYKKSIDSANKRKKDLSIVENNIKAKVAELGRLEEKRKAALKEAQTLRSNRDDDQAVNRKKLEDEYLKSMAVVERKKEELRDPRRDKNKLNNPHKPGDYGELKVKQEIVRLKIGKNPVSIQNESNHGIDIVAEISGGEKLYLFVEVKEESSRLTNDQKDPEFFIESRLEKMSASSPKAREILAKLDAGMKLEDIAVMLHAKVIDINKSTGESKVKFFYWGTSVEYIPN